MTSYPAVQDGDALLASRLAMQLLLARRGATKRGSEVAVGVCDVRGCGNLEKTLLGWRPSLLGWRPLLLG